jgi:integrase
MPTPVLKPDTKGVYYAHWSEDRRSQRKSMGTRERAEAEARFAQWLLLRGTQPDGAGAVYTVGDCWTVYSVKHLGKTVTAHGMTRTWELHLGPHFGGLTISEVNQDQVDGYVRKRTTGKLGAKVKPQTCRKELSQLMAMLNFCADPRQKMFSATVLEKWNLPPNGEARERWLRMEEMQRLLSAAARMRRGPTLSRGERFLWLALETAARKEAILDLTWDRVDFDTNTIHFDVPGRAKTKKRRAAVSISRALRPVLERAYKERENDLVMTNKASIWATVQWISIEAGFSAQAKVERGRKPKATGISPHVLRHTAATHMARAGVPLWKIAKILGNTLAVVESTYAKWAPEDPAGTVDMISGGVLETTE